jgi:hypothetical protein
MTRIKRLDRARGLPPRGASCQRAMKAPSSSFRPSRKPRRRRGRQPPADDARRLDQAARRRHLHYMPMGLRVIRKVEAIVREEMNRPARRAADAGGAAGRALAGVRPLGEVWARAAAREGPPRARLRHPADSEEVITDIARQELRSYRAAAEEFLSHPDQVPRRAPAALRRDARPRVHDEGRLFLRPRPRAAQASYDRSCTTPTPHLRAHGPAFRAVAADTAPSAATARTSSR